MKVFRILRNSIRDAFKSVFRNFSLSFASIICTTITLILLTVAILLLANVNNWTKKLESDLTIVVFMERGSTEEEANALKQNILLVDNVIEDSLIYQSNEDVKVMMQSEYDIFNSVMSEWTAENNPLQNQFTVKVKDIKRIGETATKIKEMQKVDTVRYGEGMVDQLVTIFDVVQKASAVIVISLIIVTAFLISNTIKLTIFSRKTEIEIMRLVGTSNAVIKLPFVIEGFFLGVIGSIIPILITIYGYTIAYDNLGGYVFSHVIELINPSGFVIYISLILLAVGSLVGMIGSYKAVRKYLKI